jgi:hypothetical protein
MLLHALCALSAADQPYFPAFILGEWTAKRVRGGLRLATPLTAFTAEFHLKDRSAVTVGTIW